MNPPERREGGDDPPRDQGHPARASRAQPDFYASRAERVAAAIERIWSERQHAILGQVDIIGDAVADLAVRDITEELRAPAHREAHKLAGSLGTFGFPLGSSIASEMEAILAGTTVIRRSDADRLTNLLDHLRAELGRPPVARRKGGETAPVHQPREPN